MENIFEINPHNSNQLALIFISDELKQYIPPLSSEEYRILEENILREGCKTPLVVWNQPPLWLIDGHNRYDICTRHKITFEIEYKDFDSIGEVKEWMLNFQLGRRNLNALQRSYLIGIKYNTEKKDKLENLGFNSTASQAGKSIVQASAETSTAQKIAVGFKTSASTVKRCGAIAKDLSGFPIPVKNIILKENLKPSAIKKLKDVPPEIVEEIQDSETLKFALAYKTPEQKEIEEHKSGQKFKNSENDISEKVVLSELQEENNRLREDMQFYIDFYEKYQNENNSLKNFSEKINDKERDVKAQSEGLKELLKQRDDQIAELREKVNAESESTLPDLSFYKKAELTESGYTILRGDFENLHLHIFDAVKLSWLSSTRFESKNKLIQYLKEREKGKKIIVLR